MANEITFDKLPQAYNYGRTRAISFISRVYGKRMDAPR